MPPMPRPSINNDFDGPSVHALRPELYETRPNVPQAKCSQRQLIAALPKDKPGDWDDSVDRRTVGERVTDEYLLHPSLETAMRLREWARG